MKICSALSKSNKNEANPDLMAPSDYKMPKNPADGHIFLLCIVSRRLFINRESLLIQLYSVCLISIIRLVVLGRLNTDDITCMYKITAGCSGDLT